MKKIFLFAIAAVALTVGCQKNQITAPEVDPLDDGTPVPVVFGTNVATVSTKAAIEAGNDPIPFHVYGIDDTTTDLSKKTSFLVDETVTTANPNGYTTSAYYGVNRETYSFYGYYVGGARTDARWGKDQTAPAITLGTDGTITIPVIIDGQDDLMIGLTNKATDLSNRDTSKGYAPADTELYSAKSARRGVTPKLVFDHKLVRFDFKFSNGSELTTGSEKSVWVEKVEVTSNTTGNLVITHDAKAPEDALIVTGTAGTLTLGSSKPTDGADGADTWTPLVQFGNGATDAPAGDKAHGTIMVMPIPEAEEGDEAPAQEYALKLYLNQTNAKAAVSQDLTLAMSDGKKFEAGKKYTVNITVYGLEAVIVKVEVTEWSDGGSFTYDPDSTNGNEINPNPDPES